MTRIKGRSSERCGICYHWDPGQEFDDRIVIRDGVEEKLILGACSLKGSNPDSECVCLCFEEKVEKIDDEEVQVMTSAMEEANEALIHFKTTGDRSKFKEWQEKYGGKI